MPPRQQGAPTTPNPRLQCAPQPDSIIVIDDDSPGCDDIDVVTCDDKPTTITTPKEKKQRMMVARMSTGGRGRRRQRGKSLTLTLTILMRNCVLI